MVADRDRRALKTEEFLHADARVSQGRTLPTMPSYHSVLNDRTWPRGRVGSNDPTQAYMARGTAAPM